MTEPFPHRRKQLYRAIAGDGRTQIRETSLDCGANPRGPGIWVGRAELTVPLEDLPLLADHRKSPPRAGERQRTLFEDLES